MNTIGTFKSTAVSSKSCARATLALLLPGLACIGAAHSARAQESQLNSRLWLPVVEWSLLPPASADMPRGLRVRSADSPPLTDPLAPTERLRQSRISDPAREALAAPQDLPLDRSRLVVSLRAAPGSGASMVLEQASTARTANSWLQAQNGEVPTTRVGLELRSPSTEKRLGFNVFKMQLSGGSTLLLRPRRSGVAVTWRSEF